MEAHKRRSGAFAWVVCFGAALGGLSLGARPVEQTAPAPPAPFRVEVPGSRVSLAMVPIPAGEVWVEGPAGAERRAVGGHWMATTEVPWDAFDAFVMGWDGPDRPAGVDAVARPSRPYITADRGFGREGYPALSVGLPAAEAFCAWLSAHTGQRWRLPTEAEWEHAARGGGAPAQELAERAWFRENAKRKTHPVGTRAPNGYGLFDTSGNVAEWATSDDGAGRLCGGSYLDGAADVGPTARKRPSAAWNASDPNLPKSRWWLADAPFAGFRVLCEDPPPAPAVPPGDGGQPSRSTSTP